MNLRTWLQDPNNHLLLALVSQIAKAVPQLAPYSQALDVATGTLITTGYALPEKGSLHADNYAQIAQTIAAGVTAATAKPEKAGRS